MGTNVNAAHVQDFEEHRDADDAVYEMDGKDLLGDRVSVEHCKGGRDRR